MLYTNRSKLTQSSGWYPTTDQFLTLT